MAQDRLGPTKIHGQDWILSTAQTHCQLFYRGMHLPQNYFPQMDNPCKVSGSFPQDLNCSWKGEFPAASPRPSWARMQGLPSFQGSSSRTGPNSENSFTKATPGMVNIHHLGLNILNSSSTTGSLPEDMEERVLHTHLTQQSTANSHYTLLSNYTPVLLYIWEAKKIKSQ